MKKKILLGAAALMLFASVNLKAQAPAAPPPWRTTGNSGTNPNSNFLGTTDNVALSFRTNNIERMRLSKQGNLNIESNGSYVSLSTQGLLMLGNGSGYNLNMDEDDIQARYNGGASTLYLNYYGGNVYAGSTSNSSYGLIGRGSSYGLDGYTSNTSGGAGVYGSAGSGAYGGYFYNSNGIGVYGYNASSFGHGVYGYETGGGEGVDGYAYGGSGYGVYGYSAQDIGVYGYTANSSANYAGYFVGNVYCTGSYLGSDQKLKQNIQDAPSALNIINQLHPKTYQFRQDGNYKQMNLPQGEHYGLIAQDVEKVLPNLVKDSKYDVMKPVTRQIPDPNAVPKNDKSSTDKPATISVTTMEKSGEQIDFKALNYTELIPILIKAVQEQQQQIDELKQQIQQLSSNKPVAGNTTGGYLLQNSPNPFSTTTVVRAYVPSSAKQATLQVYNTNGNLLKSYQLNNNGMNEVNLNAGTFISGQYSYSLLIDGKIADSKTMVLTK